MLTQTFKILILFVMMLSGVANAIAEEFMYVYRCKVMVGDSLCYLVKLGCDDSGITIKCDCPMIESTRSSHRSFDKIL